MRIDERDAVIREAGAMQMQIGRSSGAAYDSIGRALVVLMAMREAYAADLEALTARQAEVEAAIRGIDNPQYQDILRLRYIQSLSWIKIAHQMGNSVDNCHKMHRDALERMQFVQ